MPDAEHTTPGLVPGLVQEFVGQLRAASEDHPMTGGGRY
jgi:hypothetical protein